MIYDEHDRNTGDFTNTSFQVLIARGNDVATILVINHINLDKAISYSTNTLNNAVIGIGTFVRASETLETRIFRQTESNVISRS